MKMLSFFNTFFFCVLLLPVLSFGVQKGNNWSDRPFIKRSAGQKKTPARDGKRNNSKNNKKTSELKKTLAWYKKPAALYAAGGVASAALGAYAIFKYMQGEEVSVMLEIEKDFEPDSHDLKNLVNLDKEQEINETFSGDDLPKNGTNNPVAEGNDAIIVNTGKADNIIEERINKKIVGIAAIVSFCVVKLCVTGSLF